MQLHKIKYHILYIITFTEPCLLDWISHTIIMFGLRIIIIITYKVDENGSNTEQIL